MFNILFILFYYNHKRFKTILISFLLARKARVSLLGIYDNVVLTQHEIDYSLTYNQTTNKYNAASPDGYFYFYGLVIVS